jgi:hypothetical protein
MTVREIRGHLEELYGIDVSPDLISTVTDAVLEAVTEWQGRPLDACYPLVFFDAIRVKIRDEGFVRNKAVYIALGILQDGTKEILGIWIEQTEGAKFWMRVMNELRNRGVADILIAVVDGLRGFPEAINAVFPRTVVQTCIVHLIRNSPVRHQPCGLDLEITAELPSRHIHSPVPWSRSHLRVQETGSRPTDDSTKETVQPSGDSPTYENPTPHRGSGTWGCLASRPWVDQL